jgi:glycosyltransferase involved in cell wall biosynthesis
MVVPSRAESLPYVILEAVAGAQPLVATDVGGIPEIFGPYSDRLIRPDDDAILAQAIAAKLDQPATERSDEARELQFFAHGRFSLDGMIDGVLSGYAAAHAMKIGAAAAATP